MWRLYQQNLHVQERVSDLERKPSLWMHHPLQPALLLKVSDQPYAATSFKFLRTLDVFQLGLEAHSSF
jgi:hypothetical protein